MYSIFEQLNKIDDTISNKQTIITEKLLLEYTRPAYREMFLELLCHMSNNEEFKKLLKSGNTLNIHHIDSQYKDHKATNNKPTNIAIMIEKAHTELTNLNKEAKKRFTQGEELDKQLLHNFNRIKSMYPHEVFDIKDCLPDVIVDIIMKYNPEEI